MENTTTTPDQLHQQVETLLLETAITCGAITVKTSKAYKNPTRQLTRITKWYNEECASAKHAWMQSRHRRGPHHPHTQQAHRTYVITCRHARHNFLSTLPKLLKANPKRFW